MFQIPDVDLISRKNGIRVDSLTGDNYLRSVWDPPPIPEQVKVMGGEEEEGGEEMEEGEEEEIVSCVQIAANDKNFCLDNLFLF